MEKNEQFSLALLGLIITAAVSVFQTTGGYDSSDCIIGIVLFCIAEAYRGEFKLTERVFHISFSAIEGTALFLLLSPISNLFGGICHHIVVITIWIVCTVFAYMRIELNKFWPFE
jgi:hypothetical protein